jgi:hypothetical protein
MSDRKQKLQVKLKTIEVLLTAFASSEAEQACTEGQMGLGCIFCAASGNFTFRFL